MIRRKEEVKNLAALGVLESVGRAVDLVVRPVCHTTKIGETYGHEDGKFGFVRNQ